MYEVLENNHRRYNKSLSAAFLKTRKKWGQLSNMCAGFPISISNIIDTVGTEAIYQACRYPDHPNVQAQILSEGVTLYESKKIAWLHLECTRSDWDRARVAIMRWCLKVKIAAHWDRLYPILLESKDMPIVEISGRDNFWGAIEQGEDSNSLVGKNILGRLWMEQREIALIQGFSAYETIEPPIDNFMLLGIPIPTLTFSKSNLSIDQLSIF
ncbi:NADAR family protein [Vibrio splendidus]|nr:NADAR family protein [Vibrio splendidus]MCC4883114.1 NADAR family protein [Vibrio splendidus]